MSIGEFRFGLRSYAAFMKLPLVPSRIPMRWRADSGQPKNNNKRDLDDQQATKTTRLHASPVLRRDAPCSGRRRANAPLPREVAACTRRNFPIATTPRRYDSQRFNSAVLHRPKPQWVLGGSRGGRAMRRSLFAQAFGCALCPKEKCAGRLCDDVRHAAARTRCSEPG